VGAYRVLVADPLLADGLQFFGAAQHAGRRAAHLQVMFTHGREVKHRVEGGDFEHAYGRHAEQLGDGADRRLGDPALLLLHQPHDRDHRRLPALGRIFRDPPLRLLHGGGRKGEACWLFGGEAADAHSSSLTKSTRAIRPSRTVYMAAARKRAPFLVRAISSWSTTTSPTTMRLISRARLSG